MVPETRSELFLANIAGEENELPPPQSRIEHYLNAIAQAGTISGGSAGAVLYDPDASYPDGSVGAAMQEMDDEITENAGDISQLKSQINEVESSYPQKTASGSIVTIEDGADNVPVVSLTAEINPVQDLHGFDNPWPAKAMGNVFDESTVSFAHWINAEGQDNLASYGALSEKIYLTSGKCLVKAFGTKPNAMAICEYASDDSFITRTYETAGSVFSATLNASTAYVKVETSLSNGQTANATTLAAQKVFVVDGDTEPSTFYTYSNICPILGWTGANVYDTGVNVWDEEWELGYWANGEKYNVNTNIRSKNKIPVLPNTAYYLQIPGNFYYSYYDADGEFLTVEGYDVNGRLTKTIPGAITTPKNAYYMTFNMGSAYGTSYNHDISINYPSSDTAYHAYTGRTVNITFPDSAGTVYGGTLVLNQDGTADLTVDHAEVDMGTLAWFNNGNGSVYTNVLTDKLSGGDDCICSALVKATQGASVESMPAASFKTYAGNVNIAVKLSEITYANAQEKLSGFQLVYPLANPVTYHIENVDLVKTLYLLNNLWCDTGDIDVTYRCDPATYTAESIRLMLNAMVAPVEASTTASKAYSVNDFLIMDNVLYKVTSPIANGGTITPNTNVSATTVGAELTAILNS